MPQVQSAVTWESSANMTPKWLLRFLLLDGVGALGGILLCSVLALGLFRLKNTLAAS